MAACRAAPRARGLRGVMLAAGLGSPVRCGHHLNTPPWRADQEVEASAVTQSGWRAMDCRSLQHCAHGTNCLGRQARHAFLQSVCAMATCASML